MNYMKLEMIEKESFAGDYESVVLEQWKTCIAEANGISEKRNNSNNIFITLNTALFAVITFTLDYRSILPAHCVSCCRGTAAKSA